LKRAFIYTVFTLASCLYGAAEDRFVHVENLDCSKITQSLGRPARESAATIAGRKFERNLATQAPSRMYIALDGKAIKFSGMAGISDAAVNRTDVTPGVVGEVEFLLYGDGKLLKRSGPIKQGASPVALEADLAGVKELVLAVDGPFGAFANWVDAMIAFSGDEPRTVLAPEVRAVARFSVQLPEPRINGALVVGIRPNTPFLYTVAATGERPMKFLATGLPAGLQLDAKTGIISGSLASAGESAIEVTVQNARGKATKELKIIAGSQLALTPPMGWNSWNVTEALISETVVKETADAMVAYGFRDVGYQYIDFDDQWVVSRDSEGRPVVDPVRFPHGLKPVADYLHARGFKLGIYSSPGAKTCGGEPGTLGHEEIDAKTWTSWGVDLLKYDFCSTPPDRSHDLYVQMGELLEKSGRSIVYSLCGATPAWGMDSKAQMWRTGGDIRDTWHLGRDGGEGIIDAFEEQPKSAQLQHPGGWNDPDLLVTGIRGKGSSANDLGAKGADDTEYRSQVSLWAMLSAPLMASADLRKVSQASIDSLTNPEVIDLDQDPLGRVPALSLRQGELEVWSKDMADGSKALALLNRGDSLAKITAKWTDVGLHGKYRARDLWQRKDVGVVSDEFSAQVPRHGTVLIRVWPVE
jgi:alpha-galactosidase